jgi:hypothetical protein
MPVQRGSTASLLQGLDKEIGATFVEVESASSDADVVAARRVAGSLRSVTPDPIVANDSDDSDFEMAANPMHGAMVGPLRALSSVYPAPSTPPPPSPSTAAIDSDYLRAMELAAAAGDALPEDASDDEESKG